MLSVAILRATIVWLSSSAAPIATRPPPNVPAELSAIVLCSICTDPNELLNVYNPPPLSPAELPLIVLFVSFRLPSRNRIAPPLLAA